MARRLRVHEVALSSGPMHSNFPGYWQAWVCLSARVAQLMGWRGYRDLEAVETRKGRWDPCLG